jgi:hypothetical protein
MATPSRSTLNTSPVSDDNAAPARRLRPCRLVARAPTAASGASSATTSSACLLHGLLPASPRGPSDLAICRPREPSASCRPAQRAALVEKRESRRTILLVVPSSVRQLNSWTSAWMGESRSALLVCGMTAAVTGCVERDVRRRASGCCWRAKAAPEGLLLSGLGLIRLAAQSARRAGDRSMTRPLRAQNASGRTSSIRPDHPLRCTRTALCPSGYR